MPDRDLPPRGFWDTLPECGPISEQTAVANAVEMLRSAMRELDVEHVKRLLSPHYVHVNRLGHRLSRDEWLSYALRQRRGQRTEAACIRGIVIVDRTALVGGYVHTGPVAPNYGDPVPEHAQYLKQVWSNTRNGWVREFSSAVATDQTRVSKLP